MDKILVKQGEEYWFEGKFKPKTTTNLWASVSIKTDKGYIKLASSDDQVYVNGHTEIIKFQFPELEPGEYEYVITIGDPFEGIARIDGTYVVEKEEKKEPIRKKPSKIKEEPVQKLKVNESGIFTSSSFEGEDDGESRDRVEMP